MSSPKMYHPGCNDPRHNKPEEAAACSYVLVSMALDDGLTAFVHLDTRAHMKATSSLAEDDAKPDDEDLPLTGKAVTAVSARDPRNKITAQQMDVALSKFNASDRRPERHGIFDGKNLGTEHRLKIPSPPPAPGDDSSDSDRGGGRTQEGSGGEGSQIETGDLQREGQIITLDDDDIIW